MRRRGGKEAVSEPRKRSKVEMFDDDEEVSSASSEEAPSDEEEEVEEDEETMEAMRLRMSREALSRRRNEEDDDEEVAVRLREEREDAYIELSQEFENFDGTAAAEKAVTLRRHRGPVTTCCVSKTRAFSGSKDNSVFEHDLETGQFIRAIIDRWPAKAPAGIEKVRGGSSAEDIANRQSRQGEILALASDDRYLAVGGADCVVHVWDLRRSSQDPAASLRGHRSRVTALAFGREDTAGAGGVFMNNSQLDDPVVLYSGAEDGAVRHWRGSACVETLFGHEGPVQCLDTSTGTWPLSAGGDQTLRLWKIRDETHLVFRPHAVVGRHVGRSVDACLLLQPTKFVSAGDDGALSLWSTRRKKPLTVLPLAHGAGQPLLEKTVPQDDVTFCDSPRWISSLANYRATDLLFSGSSDGRVRLWRLPDDDDDDDKDLRPLPDTAQIPALGYVNALALPHRATGSNDPPAFLAVAASHEHRLGRWGTRVKKSPNALLIVPLLPNSSASD